MRGCSARSAEKSGRAASKRVVGDLGRSVYPQAMALFLSRRQTRRHGRRHWFKFQAATTHLQPVLPAHFFPGLEGIAMSPLSPPNSLRLIFLQYRLSERMAAQLVADFGAGRLERQLPSERDLADRYGVGRNTIRAALHILRTNKTLETRPRVGTRIARLARTSRPRPDVGLIAPVELGRLRPSVIWWIDELRAQLQQAGVSLCVHPCPGAYIGKPGRILAALLRSNPHGCWLLILAPRPLQEWFARQRIRHVVTGTAYSGLDAPSIDLDHRASGRHAAGVLLARGHKRIGLVLKRAFGAGDEETAAGFREAASQHGPATTARVIHQDETPDGARATLRSLLRQPDRPTGLLVANPHCYLAMISAAAACGLSVPRDLSLISRDDDPFLDYIDPIPARYTWRPTKFAALVATRTLAVLRGDPVVHRVRILPEYLSGGSVASAPP